jgi:hypothetical protein
MKTMYLKLSCNTAALTLGCLPVLLSTYTLWMFLVNVSTAIPTQVDFPLHLVASSYYSIRNYYLPTLTANIHNGEKQALKLHVKS